jgi:hypothetical protein
MALALRVAHPESNSSRLRTDVKTREVRNAYTTSIKPVLNVKPIHCSRMESACKTALMDCTQIPRRIVNLARVISQFTYAGLAQMTSIA